LQALRQPLEQGSVSITRSSGTVAYPCRFMLVAATNPCPCGWAGDAARACRCSPAAVDAYQRALSGPLLDRIDLNVTVPRPPLEALGREPQAESTAVVRARVLEARVRQHARQAGLNGSLRVAELRRHAALDPPARRALERWASERGLTARGFHRAWRVARTVADLAGQERVAEEHVLEALGYRLFERAA
jgi:magnesium chelatase family protein